MLLQTFPTFRKLFPKFLESTQRSAQLLSFWELLGTWSNISLELGATDTQHSGRRAQLVGNFWKPGQMLPVSLKQLLTNFWEVGRNLCVTFGDLAKCYF